MRIAFINQFKRNDGIKYKQEIIKQGLDIYNKQPCSNWLPEKNLKNKDVFIICAGPSVKKHLVGIKEFIKQKNLTVIGLNINKYLNESFINYHVACHPHRLVSEYEKLQKIRKPIILPLSQLPPKAQKKFKNVNTLDFGIVIGDTFEFHKNYSVSPTILAFSYALGIANAGKVNHIYLAGFDGYEDNDPRSNIMKETIKKYFKLDNFINIKSVTNTKYNLPSSSIYNL